MADLRFEWDPRKDAANQRKHGVSFTEAESVFADEHGLLLDDPDHSTVEDRFILLGLSARFRVSGCGACLPSGRRSHSHHLCAPGDQDGAHTLRGTVEAMRREYDFSQARRNPYASRLKQSVTIRLDAAAIAYFKDLAGKTDIPYQTLINLYLRDCAATGRKLDLQWKRRRKGAA